MSKFKNIDWRYIDNMGFLAIVSFLAMGFVVMLLQIMNNILLKFAFWILDVGIKNVVIAIGKEVLIFVIPLVVIWICVVLYCEITGK